MKINYYEEYDRFVTKVVFIEPFESGSRTAYNFVTGIGQTIPFGEMIPKECAMEIPTELFRDMVKQFAEIANDKGLKLDADLKREGQLEATREHLKDLRKLLKL